MPDDPHINEAARDERKSDERGADGDDDTVKDDAGQERLREVGGRDGPDPTRYGDWEKGGRCIDF